MKEKIEEFFDILSNLLGLGPKPIPIPVEIKKPTKK